MQELMEEIDLELIDKAEKSCDISFMSNIKQGQTPRSLHVKERVLGNRFMDYLSCRIRLSSSPSSSEILSFFKKRKELYKSDQVKVYSADFNQDKDIHLSDKFVLKETEYNEHEEYLVGLYMNK